MAAGRVRNAVPAVQLLDDYGFMYFMPLGAVSYESRAA